MAKKIFRVFGYIISALLIALSILLILCAFVFGARKTVAVFGRNIYIAQTDDIPTVPKGSAVLVTNGSAAGLEPGKLALYEKSDEDDNPTLGYVKSMEARDGVFFITVAYKNTTFEFPESKLIGRADYSSEAWGAVIAFIKSPLGVLVIAVLPCAALILFEIIRCAAANRPEPEVIPKVKNADEDIHVPEKLSVDNHGNAKYSKNYSPNTGDGSPRKADDVLFTATAAGKQKSASNINSKRIPAPNDRPIIPLTSRKPEGKAPVIPEAHESGANAKSESPAVRLDFSKPKQTEKPPLVSYTNNPRDNAAGAIPKKADNDAFFSQPLLGKQAGKQPARTDESEAVYNTARGGERSPGETHPKTEKLAGKRSAQILASRGLDDLFADDSDMPAARRHNTADSAVDDILAGLSKNDKRQ